MLLQVFRDFRHGFRLLGRAPGFTATAALILALPIAANTAVFSLVNTVLLQPRPGRIETLVEVFSHDGTPGDANRHAGGFENGVMPDPLERGVRLPPLPNHGLA
jgi:hypothetical protein